MGKNCPWARIVHCGNSCHNGQLWEELPQFLLTILTLHSHREKPTHKPNNCRSDPPEDIHMQPDKKPKFTLAILGRPSQRSAPRPGGRGGPRQVRRRRSTDWLPGREVVGATRAPRPPRRRPEDPSDTVVLCRPSVLESAGRPLPGRRAPCAELTS